MSSRPTHLSSICHPDRLHLSSINCHPDRGLQPEWRDLLSSRSRIQACPSGMFPPHNLSSRAKPRDLRSSASNMQHALSPICHPELVILSDERSEESKDPTLRNRPPSVIPTDSPFINVSSRPTHLSSICHPDRGLQLEWRDLLSSRSRIQACPSGMFPPHNLSSRAKPRDLRSSASNMQHALSSICHPERRAQRGVEGPLP